MRRWTQATLEKEALKAFAPAYVLKEPKTLKTPLIFASPHSGAKYPKPFLSMSGRTISELRKNEDAFIGQLFEDVAKLGAPFLAAQFPRCFVDVNRAADELPSDWPGAAENPTNRAKAGFGVIPQILSEDKPIYKEPLPASVTQGRLEALYHPYHSALKSLIDRALNEFGRALIVDCHSMPGFAPLGARRADIVLGDRYAQSCRPEIMQIFETRFTSQGYSVTRNYPYAGGYVTSHYGQPHTGVEAIQIEINRDLYLNPISMKPKRKGFSVLSRDIKTITSELIEDYSQLEAPMDNATPHSNSLAAE